MNLLQVASAQTAPGRDALAIAADASIVLVGLTLLVVGVALVLLLLKLRSTVQELRIAVRQNLGPVSDRARSIADNVQHVTDRLRTDVEKVDASVRAVTDRLQQASDRMEERIDEFNALMEVVQYEAEELFLDTASAARGVRASTRAIADGGRNRRPARPNARRVAGPADVAVAKRPVAEPVEILDASGEDDGRG